MKLVEVKVSYIPIYSTILNTNIHVLTKRITLSLAIISHIPKYQEEKNYLADPMFCRSDVSE